MKSIVLWVKKNNNKQILKSGYTDEYSHSDLSKHLKSSSYSTVS